MGNSYCCPNHLHKQSLRLPQSKLKPSFSSLVPFCQRQSASSGLVQKPKIPTLVAMRTKEQSSKCCPLAFARMTIADYAILFQKTKKVWCRSAFVVKALVNLPLRSTTVSVNSPWAHAQRPTPDRCECSSSSLNGYVLAYRPKFTRLFTTGTRVLL